MSTHGEVGVDRITPRIFSILAEISAADGEGWKFALDRQNWHVNKE